MQQSEPDPAVLLRLCREELGPTINHESNKEIDKKAWWHPVSPRSGGSSSRGVEFELPKKKEKKNKEKETE